MSTPQMNFPGMEDTNSLNEAQIRSAEARSAEARRIFEVENGYDPWMDDYWRLVSAGWGWRKAVYMLWAALPPGKRRPRTLADLATEILGLTTDRQIHEWKKNPAMDAEIARLAQSVLVKYRPRIYEALIEAATSPNPRAHADRRLALEMMGDYVAKQRLDVGNITSDTVGQASEDVLRQLAAGGSDE